MADDDPQDPGPAAAWEHLKREPGTPPTACKPGLLSLDTAKGPKGSGSLGTTPSTASPNHDA